MTEQNEWVLIGLDEKTAHRQGIPVRIPVPRSEFEGMAEKGLGIDDARKWIKDFLTNSELGKSGAWRKQNSAVVSSLEAFLDKTPLWERAQKAFTENDYEKALSALKRITTMDPDDHAARLNLASTQANMGDHASALKNFQAIRKTFEGDADFHVAVGQVHIALQKKDAALDEMVLALEAKPDCQVALDALVQLGVLVPIYESPRDAASLTYVRADSVLAYLNGLWDAEPRDTAFYLEQLAYHERELRHDVALAAAERALLAGGSERAELGRIAALSALKRDDEALAAAQACAEKNPASSGVQVELAKCLSAVGRSEEANAAIARALESDPGDLAALSFKFWPADAKDMQKVNGAIPALAAFAAAHPESAGARRSLARAELVAGRTDDALAGFAAAVALTPEDDELRAEYWTELGRQQRYEEILADAAKMTNIAKRDWKLRWNEAEAFAGLGKNIEARAAFSAINFDDSLHVDVRRRAKRAVKTMDETPPVVT